MENILITGATGYIGKNLAKKISCNGDNVFAVVRKDSIVCNESIKSFVFEDNVEQLAQFMTDSKIRVVVHLASFFIAEHKSEDVGNLIDSNILFGTQVLEAMRLSNVRKFVNTGTIWQHYGGKSEYEALCLYAATKEAFEKVLEFYISSEKLQAITLKLCDTYGPNDLRKKIINLLVQASKQRTVLNMSPGDQLLDLVYIDDVVDGFIAAINQVCTSSTNSCFHKKYFITSGKQITLKELVGAVRTASKNELSVNFGMFPYRKRELMKPYIPQANEVIIKAKTTLEEGLKNLF